MLKDLKRWIEIRDGKDAPATMEELTELVAFKIKWHCGMVEQAYDQRRSPSFAEMSERRLNTARLIINAVEVFTKNQE